MLLVNAFSLESGKSYSFFFLDVDLPDVDENQPYDYKFVRWMISSKVRCPSYILVLEMLFYWNPKQCNHAYSKRC